MNNISLYTQKESEDIEQHQSEKQHVVVQSQPQLRQGVNLITKPEDLPAFQSLVSNELESRDSTAVWIDSGNESSTYALRSVGTRSTMEKVYIGRAFTPFQHHTLVHGLEEFVRENTEILVLPNIDLLYLDGQVREWEAEELFEEVWQKILKTAEKHELRVLVSFSSEGKSLLQYARKDIEIEITVGATQE
ncbi:MAG: hypothetical protein J07AB43_09110, partial [Candidatus Nanosalina sp. J07AB43]